MLEQPVAFVVLDDKQMVDVRSPGVGDRGDATRIGKELHDRLPPRPGAFGCLIEVAELDGQNRRLQSIEPTIKAQHRIIIFRALTIIAKHPNTLGELRVIGDDSAPVAKCPEIFAGVKTEARRVAEAGDRRIADAGAVGLTGVLHNKQSMFLGNSQNLRQIGRLTKQVNRQNGLGARCDGALQQFDIQVVIVRDRRRRAPAWRPCR